jgi:hypothetical protein
MCQGSPENAGIRLLRSAIGPTPIIVRRCHLPAQNGTEQILSYHLRMGSKESVGDVVLKRQEYSIDFRSTGTEALRLIRPIYRAQGTPLGRLRYN